MNYEIVDNFLPEEEYKKIRAKEIASYRAWILFLVFNWYVYELYKSMIFINCRLELL